MVAYAYGTRIIYERFDHDEIGNPTIYRDGLTFEWESGRRLATIHGASERGLDWGTITMEYDHNGMRTRKSRRGGNAGDVDQFFFWEGNRLLAEEHGGQFIWYYYDEQGVAGMNFQGRDYFFLRNIFGDITDIYNAWGQWVGGYIYNAWGQTHIAPGSSSVAYWNPWRWRGKYFDQETGFYYMQSRFYDPMTGRFISADDPRMLFTESVLAPGNGANLFMYAYNNPVMFRDDSGYGFLTSLLIGIAVGAVIGGISGGINAARNDDNIWFGILGGALIGAAIGAAMPLGAAAVSGVMNAFLALGIMTVTTFGTGMASHAITESANGRGVTSDGLVIAGAITFSRGLLGFAMGGVTAGLGLWPSLNSTFNSATHRLTGTVTEVILKTIVSQIGIQTVSPFINAFWGLF